MLEASEERQQREMETPGGDEDREGSGLTSLSTKRIPTREHPQGLLRKAPAAVQSRDESAKLRLQLLMFHPHPHCTLAIYITNLKEVKDISLGFMCLC